MIATLAKLALGIVIGAVLVKESKRADSLYGELREKAVKWWRDERETPESPAEQA